MPSNADDRRTLGCRAELTKEKSLSSEETDSKDSSIEQISPRRSSDLTEELSKILYILEGAFPESVGIILDFDGRLHAHIDVHNLEAVTRVETLLPTLAGGIFHDLSRGDTPHHRFCHRVSAIVDR